MCITKKNKQIELQGEQADSGYKRCIVHFDSICFDRACARSSVISIVRISNKLYHDSYIDFFFFFFGAAEPKTRGGEVDQDDFLIFRIAPLIPDPHPPVKVVRQTGHFP